MLRFKLSLTMMLFAIQFFLPIGCIAGTTESQAESYSSENSTLAGLSARSQASVSNGNEADTHQQSMASLEANSENGAVFFNVTMPNYVPAIPSGFLPESVTGISRTPPSNYVTSAPMASNYIITGKLSSTEPSTTISNAKPKMQVWTAKGRYGSIKRSNEVLATNKLFPREIVRHPTEHIAAPAPYYQLSSTDYTPPNIWAGYTLWPAPNAFNHN